MYNVNLLQSFLLIFFLVYESKYYLQVYLDNCVYKIVNTQMIDYLGDNLLESDRNQCFDSDK